MDIRCRRLGVIITLLATLVLSACGGSVEQTVTFLEDEKWEAELLLEIPAEMLPLIGGAAAIEEELNNGIAEAEAEGIDAEWRTWREDTVLLYEISMAGSEYQVLEEELFDSGVEIDVRLVDGERQIHFSEPSSVGMFGEADSSTLTLIGGEIISTNGTIIADDTVRWENWSGPKEAILTEKGGIGLGTILLIVVGLGVVFVGGAAALGGGAYFLSRQRSAGGAAPAADIAGTGEHCPYCGTALEADAKFCFNCGRSRE